MLRVNAKERPTTSQMLAMSEVASKAELMEVQGFHGNQNRNDHGLIGTIKVPPMLKKLNEALPKACYPESRKVEEELPRGVPKPPLPPMESNENRNNSNNIPNNRKPLAPVAEKPVNSEPQPPASNRPPVPRPPVGNQQRPHYHHHRVW